MGFFDFLKKKEFERIAQLEAELAASREKSSTLEREKSALKTRVAELSPFEAVQDLDAEAKSLTKQIAELKEEYRAAREVYDRLKKQVSIFEESLDMADFGVYAPHFSFETSDEFKDQITKVRDKAKLYIKAGEAAKGGETITWNGSLSQGQAMVKRQKQLMLRAFNGEADSFTANVDWNNVTRMEERLRKSFLAVNKTYESQGIQITESYYDIKLEELRLTFEYRQKKQAEKEEQRAIREQMREEERALREMEQAKQKAEKEERMYLAALEKARKEMGQAVGEKQAELLAKIAELEAGLVGAEALKQKAISMAQQTKMGYVYVISNIGSFGENVYKIGMTRRLEPMDRVRELGDASVPFFFDTHAMIFSENAPELESQLHKEFEPYRVNKINSRREFFHLPLEEIRDAAHRYGARVEFTMLAEAEEYRESLRIKETQGAPQEAATDEFPDEI